MLRAGGARGGGAGSHDYTSQSAPRFRVSDLEAFGPGGVKCEGKVFLKRIALAFWEILQSAPLAYLSPD